jgi:ABC-2 type transport system permease protein
MKVWVIAFKEVLIVLRDRTALWLLLAAPVALTLVMALAFSRVNQGNGLAQIRLVVVNQDEGDLGQTLVGVLQSPDLSDLLAVTRLADPAEARALVDADKAAAAVMVPPSFTQQALSNAGGPARLELYGNPGRTVSTGVVRDILERFTQQVSAGVVGGQVTVRQLVESGRLPEAQAPAAASDIGRRVALAAGQRDLVTLQVTIADHQASGRFDYLAYYAPSMATLFLMFAMMSSARTLLAEREAGTLDRLRASPLLAVELLGGKILGVFAIGLLQMGALIFITRLGMGVAWGDPLAVAVHTVFVVAATAALGLVIAALARTASQANALGSTVTMVLAAAGGNFVPRLSFPVWLKTLSYIGPNAWGIEGFQSLAAGARLGDLAPDLAALALMTVVFLGLALWGLRRFVK